MMKNLFQRLTVTFLFLFGIITSLVFSSCGDDVAKAYTNEISKADALFEKEQYIDAKVVYSKAISIKNDEVYPKQQIDKIEVLLVEKAEKDLTETRVKEVEVVVKEVPLPKSEPFHIIVGSFAIQKNAVGFQKSLVSKGVQSTIVRGDNGNYLVSVTSLGTITKAYNYLNANKERFDTNAWVYRVK